ACSKPKSKLRCYGCGLEGHIKSECQGSKRQESLFVSGKSGEQNYIKECVINGHRLTALVDTGCSSVLIRKSVADAIDLPYKDEEVPLFGVGKVDLPAARAIGRALINVTIDNVKAKNVDSLVVPDDIQPYDILIGRSFTEQPHVAFVKFRNNLVFGDQNEEPFF